MRSISAALSVERCWLYCYSMQLKGGWKIGLGVYRSLQCWNVSSISALGFCSCGNPALYSLFRPKMSGLKHATIIKVYLWKTELTRASGCTQPKWEASYFPLLSWRKYFLSMLQRPIFIFPLQVTIFVVLLAWKMLHLHWLVMSVEPLVFGVLENQSTLPFLDSRSCMHLFKNILTALSSGFSNGKS